MSNPFLSPEFRIRWSQANAEQVVPAVETALREAAAGVERIGTLELAAATYETTFLALEHTLDALNVVWAKVAHLQSVADSPPLREAYNAMLPKVAAFQASIPLNAALWSRLKHVVEGAEGRTATGLRRRHIDETVKEFRQAGADLPPERRARLEALQSELAQVTQTYSEHILDATNAWQLVVTDEARLRGLPEHAKASARRSAEAKGLDGWRFTLHMPSFEPFMTYAEDAALREEMWRGSTQVGAMPPHDNTPLIQRILALRAEKAAILGYPNFADLVLERRMARSGRQALAFIEDLGRRAAAAFANDILELEEFKARQTGAPVQRLAPWELAFWAERLRRARYDFDEELLRPYFPMDRVIAGLFELAQRVFGIRVIQVSAGSPGTPLPGSEPVETWHPEVTFYDVFDRANRHVGSFYADWHPRDSKRGGAWMNYLITGGPQPDKSRAPHLGLICGNMTPPVEGRPALLTHREVETVFHEFGHLLHHLLGEVEIKSLNGVNVAWDFVELPSQIMENWAWERASLDLFARHHETGAPIPEELFKKMVAAKNFRSATAMMRQVAFAKMDLLLHLETDRFVTAPDVEPLARAAVAEYLIPTEPPAPTILKRFGHIFADPVGYAAGYYSYKWAEVLDADAFTRFKRDGIFNAQVGSEFVEHILSRGNSQDPAELYRTFMGREPDLNALLERSGLVPAGQ